MRLTRQAFAGMLWNKQFYYYEVAKWLDGDTAQPSAAAVIEFTTAALTFWYSAMGDHQPSTA
jgi:hypothetical protein